jgi:hypothetical protein
VLKVRTDPFFSFLQINISREGGQQVNVQGDVNEQKATPPRLTAMKPTQPTLGRPDQPPPFRPAFS